MKKLLIESIIIKSDDKYKELVKLALYDPLKNIKDQILLLGKIVGFTSVKDIIFLLYNIDDIHLIDEDLEKFKLINRILCPLNYDIKVIENIKKKVKTPYTLNTDSFGSQKITQILKTKEEWILHFLVSNYKKSLIFLLL